MVTLPADVFDSDSDSDSLTETDSSDDRRRGYRMPFPREVSDALRIFRRTDNTFTCPVCPGTRHWWRILNEIKDHVLGMAKSMPLRGENKKWSRHCVVAQNEGWME
uniref:Zinc finger-XS domain-containing protein n=1 Tax=Setaria viridis TaxID=4556 RepID=A0A4U6VUH8_SETVI|nr:hypothetical protein SEVIR_2G206400v2 [Setaria viridis]